MIWPDLRGYGASDKPDGDAAGYAKCESARDICALAEAFGADRFAVVRSAAESVR